MKRAITVTLRTLLAVAGCAGTPHATTTKSAHVVPYVVPHACALASNADSPECDDYQREASGLEGGAL